MNSFQQIGHPVRRSWVDEPSLFVSYIGFFESAGDFLWEQISPSYTLHLIRAGRGIFSFDGVDCEAVAGDVVMFQPDFYIQYRDFPESPWRYSWVRFEGRDVEWAVEHAGFNRQMPIRRNAASQDLFKRLRELGSAFESGSYHPLFPLAEAWSILEKVSPTAADAPLSSDAQDLAEACRLVIENQLAHVPTVDDLAQRFKVNRSTLFRAFKQCYHMSPKAYIDSLRFEKACALLKRTTQSVKEVAYACGFEQPDYFCTAFRRRYGLPPGEWRNRSD